MPPRKQKRLLLIDPIVATAAFYAACVQYFSEAVHARVFGRQHG
jgi:hypothetical protein